MAKANELPSLERLREVLGYDPETGLFRWIQPGNWRRKTRVGCVREDGYLVVRIDGTPFLAHRVAWKMITLREPPPLIDHRDTDRGNNRFDNLRVASKSENQHNSRIPANNTSGIKGVHFDKQRSKWQAQITINDKINHLGRFTTIEEAAAAVAEARERLHGEFARHS